MNNMAIEGESNYIYFNLKSAADVLDKLKECENAIICINDNGCEEYDSFKLEICNVL